MRSQKSILSGLWLDCSKLLPKSLWKYYRENKALGSKWLAILILLYYCFFDFLCWWSSSRNIEKWNKTSATEDTQVMLINIPLFMPMIYGNKSTPINPGHFCSKIYCLWSQLPFIYMENRNPISDNFLILTLFSFCLEEKEKNPSTKYFIFMTVL